MWLKHIFLHSVWYLPTLFPCPIFLSLSLPSPLSLSLSFSLSLFLSLSLSLSLSPTISPTISPAIKAVLKILKKHFRSTCKASLATEHVLPIPSTLVLQWILHSVCQSWTAPDDGRFTRHSDGEKRRANRKRCFLSKMLLMTTGLDFSQRTFLRISTCRPWN